jgi:hypothetical protein
LERFVGINLKFSRDLRLLARLASRSAVLSLDLETFHPILDRPSLHLAICAASSLRNTGRPDLLQRLLELRASLPVHELLALWKQAVLPAESKDELVRRLLTDGMRDVTAVEVSPHDATEAASSQPEPAVHVHEHADDLNNPDLPCSGSAVESLLSRAEEPFQANVSRAVRIVLDHLLTINRRRADRLAALQSLLERLDSETFKQWHVVMNELGRIGSELAEALNACKTAGLADMQ